MNIVHKSDGPINNNNSSENEQLYNLLNELPKPPANMRLNATQKKWWYWFGNEFVKTKQFANLDLNHLQKAAFWMDARCRAYKVINSLNRKDTDGIAGLVQKFASGATNVTGYVSILEKADKHLEEVSAHFGLSIKDRKKLGAVTENENQLSLLDQFFNKTEQIGKAQ